MSRNTQQARHEEGRAEGHLSQRSQLTRRSAPCLHSTPRTDSCLNTHLLIQTHTHTSHACIVWWGMTSPHTHKHTQAAAQWPESRTGRHRWSFLGINCMSSCPLVHTHTLTNAPWNPTWPQKKSTQVLKNVRHFGDFWWKQQMSRFFCPAMSLW